MENDQNAIMLNHEYQHGSFMLNFKIEKNAFYIAWLFENYLSFELFFDWWVSN